MLRLKVRNVLEEFEAHLRPVGTRNDRARGKSERKCYSNGEERLRIIARGLALPGRTMVDVRINGRFWSAEHVTAGRISIDCSSRFYRIPAVAAGDRLELVSSGIVLLEGVFESE